MLFSNSPVLCLVILVNNSKHKTQKIIKIKTIKTQHKNSTFLKFV